MVVITTEIADGLGIVALGKREWSNFPEYIRIEVHNGTISLAPVANRIITIIALVHYPYGSSSSSSLPSLSCMCIQSRVTDYHLLRLWLLLSRL